ncbi:MAG: DNA-(Apurinic or apyrimidinic site) lyase [Acidobacteria bacterium]|nr:DNA-(Apurinic or apyrimidinic site) lyase [Acidobacteriota bacterium]
MQRDHQPVTIEKVRAVHNARRKEIRTRLAEFDEVWRSGSDARLWEELVFCIFTAGASARMGFRSIEAIRSLLLEGSSEAMTEALKAAGAHRFPNARPGYVVVTRNYLQQHCRMRLRESLLSFSDPIERRDWLARERGVKGLGYKEASHFLRNIGLRGYAILDKHVLHCLTDLGVVDSPRPPTTRSRYLELEEKLRQFAGSAGIDFDELDLVLWSMKTGEVLK